MLLGDIPFANEFSTLLPSKLAVLTYPTYAPAARFSASRRKSLRWGIYPELYYENLLDLMVFSD
jgi:hypothetical protein